MRRRSRWGGGALNAAEARERAISEQVVADAKKLLLDQITAACDAGKTSTIVSGVRLEVAARALDGLGYVLESTFFGAVLVVSWETS